MARNVVPAKAGAAAQQQPQLSATLKKILLDPMDHTTGQPSPKLWVAPAWRIPSEQLVEGRAAIEILLKPAGQDQARRILFPLMLSQRFENMDGMPDDKREAFIAGRLSEVARHTSHVPPDILQECADQVARESPFFPAPADVLKHATPKIEARKNQATRIALLISGGGAAQAKPAFEAEPLEVRLRTVIAAGHKHRNSFMGARLWARACKAELDLAKLEQREPADWIRDQPVPPPPAPEAATVKRSEEQERIVNASRAAKKALQDAGFPLVSSSPADEPPLPDEIPE